MKVLLRLMRPGPEGASEYQDTELSADVLAVGSAADCTIQLLGEGVVAHHATLRAASGRCVIACARGCRVTVNGQTTGSATARIGDLIEIGGHRLRVIEPPAGFDLGLELELDPRVPLSAYERAFRTDLEVTWLTKRRAAWALTAAVLLLAFVIPYMSIAPQRAHAVLIPHLPSDQFWNAGPLIPAHQLAAGQRCANCHQQLFVHVRDQDCRECHHAIADHVTQTRLAQTQLGPKQRCAQCHREHHAPPTGLVVRDNSLCVDCHSKSDTAFGPLKVQRAAGFSLATHPAFTVSLLKAGAALDDNGQPQWVTRREPIETAREQSNLTFSHAAHLDPQHVTHAKDGTALGCGDCHSLDADGEHFVPVTMQRSCGTSGCHELKFDPNAPDRVLPHGRPRDAMLLIQDYFVRQAVAPVAQATEFQRRRLPDQMEVSRCTDSPLTCALRRAQTEIENQFTTHLGCSECHRVLDKHTADVLTRFEVAPVRLTRDYFPQVHFSHRQHAVQKDRSGDAACLSCHEVRHSDSSAEVFIPKLGKCLECHSERLTADRVTLQCASCHSYHPTTMERLREADAQ
jgi:predicted CXXCH cytochrome family protein